MDWVKPCMFSHVLKKIGQTNSFQKVKDEDKVSPISDKYTDAYACVILHNINTSSTSDHSDKKIARKQGSTATTNLKVVWNSCLMPGNTLHYKHPLSGERSIFDFRTLPEFLISHLCLNCWYTTKTVLKYPFSVSMWSTEEEQKNGTGETGSAYKYQNVWNYL